MSPSDVTLLLSGIATEQGCELNASHPVFETTFPLTGDRIEGLIRPVVTDAAFAIRTTREEDLQVARLRGAKRSDKLQRSAERAEPAEFVF